MKTKLRNRIVIGALVLGCVVPSSMAGLPWTAGNWGQGLFRRLVTKASETTVAKLIEELIERGLSRPEPEVYELASSPSYYSDRFQGFMGTMPRTTRYRMMWMDPASGAQRFETSTTVAGTNETSQEPFHWWEHTRKYACKDPSPNRAYDYTIRANLKYRVRNWVVKSSPAHAVAVHPARLVVVGQRTPANCHPLPGSSNDGTVHEVAFCEVPRNGSTEVSVEFENMSVTHAYPEYNAL